MRRRWRASGSGSRSNYPVRMAVAPPVRLVPGRPRGRLRLTRVLARAWGDTIRLARAHELSVYDASYLELATRTGIPLASLDDKLKAAAQAVGVPLYKP